MKKDSVIFFGSGPVAAKSLELLIENFEIEAVITKPKPAHHRGSFPVLNVCQQNNLKTHYPTSKKQITELFQSTTFHSQVGIVIDYGFIIEKSVIESFEKGIINSHFSLLPEWRGADPISFAILSGQKKTGVSLMLIDEHMDTGDLLAQKELLIDQKETTESLTSKLIQLSSELLTKNVSKYLSGEITEHPQSSHPITYSRKLTKNDGQLEFNKPATVLEREVRAFSDWPKSHTKLADKDVVILKASASNATYGTLGVAYQTDDKMIAIPTQNGTLIIEELKPAGKQAMSSTAFLAGHKL